MNLLRRPSVRMLWSVALSTMLGALLIATIHFTRFDLQWLTFLGGVLFAAVLALASQASKVEWLLMRRSKQLERVREQLSQEIVRSRNTAHGLQAAEKRMQQVNDQLPIPFLYADRDERCRYHNQACAEWLGLPAESISDTLLRDIFGDERYALIAPQIARTLSRGAVDYDLAWPGKNGKAAALKVRQIPYSPDDSQIIGFYLVATQSPAAPAAAEESSESAANGLSSPDESSETLYLRSITDELMTGVDPRARIGHALQQDEFLLFTQKILSLKSGAPEPDCYEILLRLKEEEDNLLPPGGFIPVAERYGMLEEIDRWVVCRLIVRCLNKLQTSPGWRIPLFCINLSGTSAGSPEFAGFVRHELERTGFPARALCFEISEPDVIKHDNGVRRLIAALRPAGCRFSIDDFGSAKVSFSYLKGLTVDFLKIDGSIIRNLVRDSTELAKARAINTVCQKGGIRTVAESVETKETLDSLREIGINYVQGFGIAFPAPLANLL